MARVLYTRFHKENFWQHMGHTRKSSGALKATVLVWILKIIRQSIVLLGRKIQRIQMLNGVSMEYSEGTTWFITQFLVETT
ncbi:U3 putative protein [Kolongo virus]|uniref:Uncharacterized protein n=1 Tax=Kolongo virus TaxID=380436 RepID=A0AAE9BN38_9RHAB|nr:U3 putative protein [Kolongo virus]UAU42885.1 U3 putative protein [Kolongo virus]